MQTENEKIQELVDDLERLEIGHMMDSALFTLDLDWHKKRKAEHLAKAAAYRFVKRKVMRVFNLSFSKQTTSR